MKINTNINSINAQRMISRSQLQQQQAMERLSSGLRINSAKDDAAGLAISSGFNSQIRGLSQAIRNTNDGISALQTADGALGEMVNSLQRVRELSVQASSGTYSASNRARLNDEAMALLEEIGNVSASTQFNQVKLFEQGERPDYVDPTRQFMVDHLYENWFAESEKTILQQYGIQADGKSDNLSIRFDDDPNSEFAATISFSGNDQDNLGRAEKQALTIYTEAFNDFNPGDGGYGFSYVDYDSNGDGTADGQHRFEANYHDRIMMHEMAHAVMGSTMDMTELPVWFKEGTAELIHGAKGSVHRELVLQNDATAAAAIAAMTITSDSTTGFAYTDMTTWVGGNTDFFNNWDSSSSDYALGYVAVRYLHDDIKANGGTGVADLMSYLSDEANLLANANITALNADGSINEGGGVDNHLDRAIQYLNTQGLTSFADEEALRAAFSNTGLGNGGGDEYIRDNFDFGSTDTGAIGGIDVEGGKGILKTAESIVDNSEKFLTLNPLENYKVTLDASKVIDPTLARQYNLHVGSGSDHSMSINLYKVSNESLGLSKLNLETDPQGAIDLVDRALGIISENRARLGANMNRLQATVSINENTRQNLAASNSRIQDADFATETSKLSKTQILQQASTSMLAQANASGNSVLSLLG